MSSERLKVGVVGVGSLGFHHARILREIPDAELVGVHDSNPGRLAEVGEKLGVTTFPELDALADRVEAAVIAVPTTHHEAVA
ncbi:MAG TPA: Gfo/Idh/MocA family oxidoreductase, partial [Longimicrobiales bacterium]